ncbi:hypothetical protein G6F62_011110 [Rhizopus arrhizus]|nr:hypothetical protein G6F62_011110 [Rhizopus arrhizus]
MADVPRLTRHPRYTWHLGKLRDPNKCKTYGEHFREFSESLLHFDGTHIPLTDPLAAIAYIEQFNNDLCQAIYTALDETCDRVTNPGDPIREFWTNELQTAIDFRELCYRKWRKAEGLNKVHYWLQHQEACATVRRLITQHRRATWKDFCKRLASCDYTKAISKINRIRKNPSQLETIFSGAHQRTVQCNEITTPALPFAVECPITADDISSAIRSLPVKKAPGVDHLRIEMLHPIQHLLQPLLLHLFQLNWAWSYVPQPWRIAQVVPIHKKGSPSDPGNYRPISLITIFRKILERCIQHTLRSEGPPLDIAQGGFRESRSALDQAICLSEICQILRSQFRITPVLAFLDIKSAYDTVNRNFIWETLSQYISPPLLGLLRNLFDDVQIEVLLSNATSRQFRPNTGVLQGSILSPYLYSVYINQLLVQLRPQAFPSSSLPLEMIPSLNCLLYADDVVLIAERSNLVDLLRKCENHSIQMEPIQMRDFGQ